MLIYHRITSIDDRYFGPLHKLLQTIFPPEEVLAAEFLEGYYSALPNKPAEWIRMMEKIRASETLELLPL